MYTYENARRGKKKKAYSAKQLAAHAVSRRAFERAKAILAVKGCSSADALRQAWAEIKGTRAASNPYHGHSRHSRHYSNPSSGVEIVEDDRKFRIYIDGADTGKYRMTRARAEEAAADM